MRDDRSFLIAIPLLALIPFLPALLTGEVLTFRDHTDYFVPMRHYTAERLSSGDLPLWNPYSGSGERWLANPQTAVFYPPAWLFVVLPFATAYVLFLVLHIALAGIGSWLLFRRWSGDGALIGTVIVMLSGPTLSLLDISNNLATFAWIPLVVYLAMTRASIPLRAGAIAMMFLGGEPLLAVIGALAYATAFLASRRFQAGYRDLAAVTALAAALSAAQLIPFLELLGGSDRLGGFAAEDSMRNSIPPLDWLFSILATLPSFRPLPAAQQFIPTLYLGVPALILSLVGIWASVKSNDPRRNVAVAAIVLLFVIVLLAAAGSLSVAGELWMRLALNISRYPARFAPLAAILVGLLVAIGVDAVSRLGRVEKLTILLLSAIVVCSALLRLQPLSFDVQKGRIAVAAMMFAVISAAIFAVQPQTEKRRAIAIVLFAVIVAADLLASSLPFFESRRFSSSIAPYDALLSRSEKVFRLTRDDESSVHPFGVHRRAWLSGYLNLLGKRFDASTPAPVVPAGYLAIHDAALRHPRIDLVDFLSVRALLTDREIDHPQFRREAKVANVTLYRNRNAFPMVTTWSTHEAAQSDEEARAKLLGGVDARRTLFIAGVPAPEIPKNSALPRGEASFEIDADRAVIETSVRFPSIVVVNQLAARGWRVFVDGRESVPLTADGLFRAVAVPEGRHRIEWRYQPRFVTIGIAISAIALVVSLLFARFARGNSSRES